MVFSSAGIYVRIGPLPSRFPNHFACASLIGRDFRQDEVVKGSLFHSEMFNYKSWSLPTPDHNTRHFFKCLMYITSFLFTQLHELLIQSFSKSLLRASSVPSTVLGSGNKAVEKSPGSLAVYILVKIIGNKNQPIKYNVNFVQGGVR